MAASLVDETHGKFSFPFIVHLHSGANMVHPTGNTNLSLCTTRRSVPRARDGCVRHIRKLPSPAPHADFATSVGRHQGRLSCRTCDTPALSAWMLSLSGTSQRALSPANFVVFAFPLAHLGETSDQHRRCIPGETRRLHAAVHAPRTGFLRSLPIDRRATYTPLWSSSGVPLQWRLWRSALRPVRQLPCGDAPRESADWVLVPTFATSDIMHPVSTGVRRPGRA